MVIGNKENVRSIRFTHKGIDLKFQCKCRIMPIPESIDEIVREQPASMIDFVFNDLSEIDALSEMILRFKRECEDVIGNWGIR